MPHPVDVIPPLLTPLTTSGTVDKDSLANLATRVLDGGCTGVWVNGTTGEFFALSADDRRLALEGAIGAAGQAHEVIAHVGDTSLNRAVEMARDAAATGATGVAAITPYYLAHDDPELEIYYRAIATATDLSLMGYHLPSFTKITLRPGFVTRLHAEGVMDGFKESSEDITYLRSLVDAQRESGTYFRVFIGGGRLLDASLLSGATGAMPAIANLIPKTVVALVEAFSLGAWETVQAAQADIRRVTLDVALTGRPSWGTMMLSMKAILKMLDVIETDVCTPGLRPLTADERATLRDIALPHVLNAEARWAPKAAANAKPASS